MKRELSPRQKKTAASSRARRNSASSELYAADGGSQNAKKSSFSFTMSPPHVYIRMHSKRDRVRQKLQFLICQGGSVHLFHKRISKNSADDHYTDSNISETIKGLKVHDKTYSMYTDPWKKNTGTNRGHQGLRVMLWLRTYLHGHWLGFDDPPPVLWYHLTPSHLQEINCDWLKNTVMSK